VFQCGAVCCRLLPFVAVCCSLLQSVAVCRVSQCDHAGVCVVYVQYTDRLVVTHTHRHTHTDCMHSCMYVYMVVHMVDNENDTS